MEKEFIPYEQALALKELGFDEESLYCYFPNPNYKMGEKFDLVETTRILPSQIKNIGKLIKDGSFENTILAPLYQQIFRWFREKHNLFTQDFIDLDNKFTKNIVKVLNNGQDFFYLDYYKTYEEAELECLKNLIEIAQKEN